MCQNLITLLSRLVHYHVERGRKTHPAAESAKQFLLDLSKCTFERLKELAESKSYDLRHDRGARRIRFTPLFLGQLARVETSSLSLISSSQWSDLSSWVSSRRDESEIYSKLILSSLNLTRHSKARSFVNDLLVDSSSTVACYFVQLVQLWINQQMTWIYEDTWCITRIIKLLAKRDDKDPLINPAIESIRLLIANQTLRESVEYDDFVTQVMAINSKIVKNRVLVVITISEALCRKINHYPDTIFDTALDALIDFWLVSGQYEFVDEIDARLRQSYTTSQVKHYIPGEAPPRRSHRHGARLGVKLPVNLFRLMSRHKFGIMKINERVIESVKEHAKQNIIDDETLLDRRVNIWSIACLLSTDLGCGEFASELMVILTRNQLSNSLSIKATVFYALSLISTCSLGAECVESTGVWRAKKGKGRRETQRSTNSSSEYSGEAANGGGSREQLLQSLSDKDFDKPLMVSILRQWSRDHISDSSCNLTQVPTTILRDRFREQRSCSDTTAMELTILRHTAAIQSQSTPNRKIVPIATSTPPPTAKLNKLAPLPEYKRDSPESIDLDSLELESSLYIPSSSYNQNAANNTVSILKITISEILFQASKTKTKVIRLKSTTY